MAGLYEHGTKELGFKKQTLCEPALQQSTLHERNSLSIVSWKLVYKFHPIVPNKFHFGLHEFAYNPNLYVNDMDIKFLKNSSSFCTS